ncbi:XRE family transcriptional regulator [Saccharomonospora xinjiangensis]|uniref:helix-turn-helix domain-containing protein n=1 Tax=Saccharomonospora xinjiangensis TaxID=75294 RepID=UPI00106FA1BA|nr:XRE family transcriptional regulator [Saccharomonospora xinjiangensis]QBQ61465.1 anaerobic benzoate catabolism transcriptional regulator [Saccharomonospora xinjiangensis]
MQPHPAIDATLDQIGPRLRRVREKRNVSLTELSRRTGVSKSTLSRLETGHRRPSLELLLPIAAALAVPLDEIVAAPSIVDPRMPQKPRRAQGRVIVPLSRTQGEPKAYKLTIPASECEPFARTHTGYEWLYVLSGRLRLVLGDYDVVLGPGEVAEFDTQHPHWFGSTGRGSVEVLSLFGKQGERAHIRTRQAPRH